MDTCFHASAQGGWPDGLWRFMEMTLVNQSMYACHCSKQLPVVTRKPLDLVAIAYLWLWAFALAFVDRSKEGVRRHQAIACHQSATPGNAWSQSAKREFTAFPYSVALASKI